MAGKVWLPTGAFRGLRAEISKAILGAGGALVEQFRCIAETVSTETRSRRWLAGHGDNLHHVISEDGKRIGARLGKAVWGVLDPVGP
jgi:hypothetical protein